MRLAKEAIRQHGGPFYARVFYRFTCAGCESREFVRVPNELPISASCLVCRHVTTILVADFVLNVRRSLDEDWDVAPSFVIPP
jgi:hypothetical protein